MAYTQAWDETIPADTQAANLLGDNIRDLKRDARERVATFGAGVIASRETPEAVWGDANKGIMYFSTDEGKIYRWNGSTWVEITSNFLGTLLKDFGDYTPVTVTNPGAETLGIDVIIPGGTLIAGSVVQIFAFVRNSAGTDFRPQNLYFGTVKIGSATPQISGDYIILAGVIQVITTVSQKAVFYSQNFNGTVGGTVVTYTAALTENLANPVTVKTTSDAATPLTQVHEFINVRTRK